MQLLLHLEQVATIDRNTKVGEIQKVEVVGLVKYNNAQNRFTKVKLYQQE